MVLTKYPKPIVAKPKARGKSLPKRQRGQQTQHYCHHCGIQRHSRPNCYKLQALKNVDRQKPRRQGKGNGKPKQPKGKEGCQDICGTCQNICYCKLANPLTKHTLLIIGQIQDGFSISRNKSSSLVLKPCKSVQETSEEVLFIKVRQIISFQV